MAERSLPHRLWYEFCRVVAFFAFVLGYSIRYRGREHIPSEGAVLLIPNHQSHLDPPLVGACCTRHMNYLAIETLFRFRPLGWLLRSVDAIPIDPEGSSLRGMKEALRRLKRGEMMVVFAEGSRTEDGEIGPFLPGFEALAVRSRAAIVPVAIEGTCEAWPRWRRFPRLGPIHVHYGEPILPEELGEYGQRELAAEVERRVRRQHAALRRLPAFARRRGSGGRRSARSVGPGSR